MNGNKFDCNALLHMTDFIYGKRTFAYVHDPIMIDNCTDYSFALVNRDGVVTEYFIGESDLNRYLSNSWAGALTDDIIESVELWFCMFVGADNLILSELQKLVLDRLLRIVGDAYQMFCMRTMDRISGTL